MSDTKDESRVIRAKVVLVGPPGVGKTSLVRRFVHSLFSDEYRSTLGVKVDRKIVVVERAAVTMLLWDMHGEAEGLAVPTNYLRGAAASLAVFDAMRLETISIAAGLCDRVQQVSPNVYSIAVANKADLGPDWAEVGEAAMQIAASRIHHTSAKTGEGVEEAFIDIATAIYERASGTAS